MVALLLTRSIPLSRTTRDAWSNSGVRIVSRMRANSGDISKTVSDNKARAVINLGNLDINFASLNIPVFNRPDTIRAVSRPLALRRTLPDFIPEHSISGAHWHKTGGFGGRGKSFHEKTLGECAVMAGDVQQHVEGTEFRVITVGDSVVQAAEKSGPVGNFDYKWVGVKGVRQNGIIPRLKDAVDRVPGGEFSIFGWDVIVGPSGIHILECNTSPGVNDFTAQRIVNQIERILS